MRKEIENDVRARVREVMSRGDGLILQGKLGVDSIALDEALRIDPLAKRIKVYIPIKQKSYAKYYRDGADKGSIPRKNAAELIVQLFLLYQTNTEALIEANDSEKVNMECWEERARIAFEKADELEMFAVGNNKIFPELQNVTRKKGITINRTVYEIP